MNYRTMMRGATAFVSTMMLCTAPQAAGLFRAYLASTGNDANPCTLSQPCRLLPAALAAVADGGEIWMLDSANYNTATVAINKSVTLLAAPGAVGSVVAAGGDAISINGAGIRVILVNLVVVNLGGGANGVSFTQGASLTIRDSSFTNLPAAAVNFAVIGAKGQIVNSTFNGNAVAVRVNGGIVNLENNNLFNNGVAVEATGPGDGTGPCCLSPPNGTTRVRIGATNNIWDNGTAFSMIDAGRRRGEQCNGSNIFVYVPRVLGNSMYVSATGASDANPALGCAGPPVISTIDSYQYQDR